MTTYYTSDLHLFHRAVSYDRRYGGWPQDKSLVTDEDVAWHNDTLAQNWDKLIKPVDRVWVLGDLIANNRMLEAALDWVEQRPGEKFMILGNHDPAHPMHSQAHKFLKPYFRSFAYVSIAAKRKIYLPTGTHQEVMLSHFPYEGDGDGKAEREVPWRLRNTSIPVLHGHVHSKEQLTFGVKEVEGGGEGPYTVAVARQIHVGPDAWGLTPVSEQQIAELLV